MSNRGWRLGLGEVGDLHGLAPLGALADERVAEADRVLAHRRQVLLGHVVAGLEHELAPRLVEHVDGAAAGVRHLAGVAEDGVEHRLQVERGVDGLAHLPERLQLGDRAGQLGRARLHLLEQPRVLDGDDGLVGEGLDKLDLTLAVRLHARAIQDDHAGCLAVAQQRHPQDRAAIVASQRWA